MTLRRVRQILKALADDTRLRIMGLLGRRRLTVSELGAVLRVSQSNLSRHLARLRLTGLVVDRREGQNVSYGVAEVGDGDGRLLEAVTASVRALPSVRADAQRIAQVKLAGRRSGQSRLRRPRRGR